MGSVDKTVKLSSSLRAFSRNSAHADERIKRGGESVALPPCRIASTLASNHCAQGKMSASTVASTSRWTLDYASPPYVPPAASFRPKWTADRSGPSNRANKVKVVPPPAYAPAQTKDKVCGTGAAAASSWADRSPPSPASSPARRPPRRPSPGPPSISTNCASKRPGNSPPRPRKPSPCRLS